MRKKITILTSLVLTFVLAIVGIFSINYSNSGNNQLVRSVELQESSVDYDSILKEFEDSTIEEYGTTTYFTGFKILDASLFDELDNISVEDKEQVEGAKVKYNFSYDKECNIVTIKAELLLEDGEIRIDEISGVAFINDEGEIDAVMNVDGEGVLLSEMKNAGLIENCGWFTKIIKVVATATAVFATTVAVAALCVATVGAAAPALVGITIASSSVIASSLTIASTSLTIAMIASGVAITASVVEITFENVKYNLIEATNEMLDNLRKNGLYVLAAAKTDTGAMLLSTVTVTIEVAARAMKCGLSTYTFLPTSAYNVASLASDGGAPVHDVAHHTGYFNHYHRANRKGVAHAFYGLPNFSV